MKHEVNKIRNTTEVAEHVSGIPKPYVKTPDNPKMVFSFELYDKNEYFGINSACEGWTARLIDELKNFSQFTLKDMQDSNHKKSIRFHSLGSAVNCPCNPPANISLKEMEQVEIGSKRNGRIHFIRVDNIIYIIWFDPLHNAYPKNGLGVRKLSSLKTCMCDELEKKVQELEQQIKELENDIENFTR